MDCLTQAAPRVQSQFSLRFHRIPWDSLSFLRSEKSLSMLGLYIQLFWWFQYSINEYYIGLWPPCSCYILQRTHNCLLSLAKHHSCSEDQPDSLQNMTCASVTNNASSSLQRHYTATLAIQRHTCENSDSMRRRTKIVPCCTLHKRYRYKRCKLSSGQRRWCDGRSNDVSRVPNWLTSFEGKRVHQLDATLTK